jgi:hypothetical protein
MNLEQSAIFLTGSILTMLGFLVIVIGVVVINNILHKYWKPVKFLNYSDYSPRFIEDSQIQEKK